jgi:chorismate mutase
MQSNGTKYILLAVLASGGIGTALAQSAVDQLQPLVEISAGRLIVAEQVALAKWDSGAAVEDAPREAQVIIDAVKIGEAKGLDRTSVSNFFKAQIEANKIVQYSLLADWRRTSGVPAHAPVNLVKTIRPKLDQIQTGLIAELAHTTEVRSKTTCRVDVAKAVGRYVSMHKHDSIPMLEIALDRALASACTP